MKYYTDFEVSDNDDSEIRHHLAVNTTIVQENDLLGNLQEQRSCWNKMKRVLAYQQRVFTFVKGKKILLI